MWRQLKAQGVSVGKLRVQRAMQREAIRARGKRRFRVCTTDSNHALPVAPNLLARHFTVSAPNTVWVGDMTCIPTEEGWLYLAVVLDLFSRRIVGWSMGEAITAELACRALEMAWQQRSPGNGLIFHSDRGSQYASRCYTELLVRQGIKASMSRKGNCWDNACSETLFGSLKVERLHGEQFKTHREGKDAVVEWLLWYNGSRLHSTLGYLSPAPFPPFDRFTQMKEPQAKSLEQLLDDFAALRRESLTALQSLNLQPQDLARPGRHPSLGSVTLAQLLSTWAVHDLSHLHQLSRVMAHQYREAVGPWSIYLGVLQCAGHSA